MIPMDGKTVRKGIYAECREKIAQYGPKYGRVPGLAVLMVGDNEASGSYVHSKELAARKLGILSEVVKLPSESSAAAVLAEIRRLNADDRFDAVLVQLPLPQGLDTWRLLDQLDPAKDVDGFHPVNLGNLVIQREAVIPCTPCGILKLLEHYQVPIAGKHAVVLGRSFIVGRPMASLLLNRHATVTVCHSRTVDLGEQIARADILVAAVGQPGMVRPEMVKPGAVLIDVGINHITRLEDARELCLPEELERFKERGYAMTGDIHPGAFEKASYYTPVPGGVGVMTVAMLMANTVRLFERHMGVGDG
jgi:methylenetetrahydrofolate dehydrogenase (NADP+)/methenyltetrahydrofolate cyclohydrolase